MNKKLSDFSLYIGSLALLLGAITWIFHIYIFQIIYAIGAVLLLYYYMSIIKKKSASLRIKRIKMMGLFSGLCYLISAYFYMNPNNLWILFFCSGSVFFIYSLLIASFSKKE